MTKGSTPAPTDRMPTPAKVAAILLGLLALLLLVNASLGYVGLAVILDRFAESAGKDDLAFDREAASGQLKTLFGTNAVIGLACAAACFLLARRNKIGRLLGIGCAAIQLSLAVLNAIGVGGILTYTLLIMVLTVAILITLFRGATVNWLRREPAA